MVPANKLVSLAGVRDDFYLQTFPHNIKRFTHNKMTLIHPIKTLAHIKRFTHNIISLMHHIKKLVQHIIRNKHNTIEKHLILWIMICF